MTVKIMSRKSAHKYSCDPNIFKTAMISISSLGCDINGIAIREDGVYKVLFLSFNDVETEDGGMQEKDAKLIAKFIKEITEDTLENPDVLVVHCDAGISRSSGVAAAIMKFLYDDDSKVFDSFLYQPNMRCYRLVLNALHDAFDNDIKEKEKNK